MIKRIATAAAALCALLIGLPAAAETAKPAAAGATLTLTVEGVRSSKGQIMAALLKADPAAEKATQVAGTMVAAKDGTVTLMFPGLGDGAYAVQLFHDEDGDGKMATNLFGIPTEGYAFSNRAKASFGPPKFADMKIDIAGADTATVAVMAY
jgi:uncharacterized protein (DUF2141 family)